MHGLHLTAELHGCTGSTSRVLMADPDALRALCRQVVAAAGLTPVGEVFHHFAPGGGVTGVVLLAESHLAVHTWPELAAVTLDVYVCNVHADNSERAVAVVDALEAAFAPRRRRRQRLVRGLPGGAFVAAAGGSAIKSAVGSTLDPTLDSAVGSAVGTAGGTPSLSDAAVDMEQGPAGVALPP